MAPRTAPRFAPRKRPAKRKAAPLGRVAVVDIGSNTVRMVVYDVPARLPVPLFNEKAQCALARGLTKTGRLNPEGADEAFRSLARFIRLSRAMGVERLELVATAAVRNASDGRAFVQAIERRFRVKVEVPSGAEEARLAALGLLSGVPAADGLLGDLGGGSLDLVVLDKGKFRQNATLPLGHLILPERAGDVPAKAKAIVNEHLEGLPWIGRIKGRSLYAVGGSWRTIARMFIEQTRHPLHVIDNYAIETEEALRLADLIAGLSPRTLLKIPTIPNRRAETLPYAAMVMRALLEIARPARMIFSGFGMREGKLLESLPPAMRKQDPLVSGAATLAERAGRFSISGEEIRDWIEPLFPDDNPDARRLRLVASLLSDIGWTEHPDYRGEHAFHRVLRLPFAGLTHSDRVHLALAIFVRYNGAADSPLVAPVMSLLRKGELEQVQVLGLALRLAHTVSGSAPGLLSRTSLKIKKNELVLQVPEDGTPFVSETVERRLRTLGRAKGLSARIA